MNIAEQNAVTGIAIAARTIAATFNGLADTMKTAADAIAQFANSIDPEELPGTPVIIVQNIARYRAIQMEHPRYRDYLAVTPRNYDDVTRGITVGEIRTDPGSTIGASTLQEITAYLTERRAEL